MLRRSLRESCLAAIVAAVTVTVSACGGGAISDSAKEAAGTDIEVSAINGDQAGSAAGQTGNTGGTAAPGEKYPAVDATMINFKGDDAYRRWGGGTVTLFKCKGKEVDYDAKTPTVSCEGTDITISSGGTYVFEGDLADGSVTVDAGKSEKVRIVLNGFSIENADGPAFNIIQADKVTVSVEANTENTVTDGENYTDTSLTAAIYSMADLVFNGTGKLTVNAKHNNAIQSKDDLRIMGGEYVIDSVDDGIIGRDRLEIKDGTFKLKCEGDALKSTNTDNPTRGFVYIENGEFSITSGDEAIDSAASVLIEGGSFKAVTGGGAIEPEAANNNAEKGFGEQGRSGGIGFGRKSKGRTRQNTESGKAFAPMSAEESGKAAAPVSAEENSNAAALVSVEETSKAAAPVSAEENSNAAASVSAEESGKAIAPINAAKNLEISPQAGIMMMSADTRQGEPAADENTDGDATAALENGEPAADLNTSGDAAAALENGNAGAKGIASGGILEIKGGTFDINAQDDALHSDDEVRISGGDVSIQTGDDGIHADNILDISGGKVTISESYEGLEAVYINLSGGETSVTAWDDGVNAAGGDSSASEDSSGNGLAGQQEAGTAGGDLPAREGGPDNGSTGQQEAGTAGGDLPAREGSPDNGSAGQQEAGTAAGEMPGGTPPEGDMSFAGGHPEGMPFEEGDGSGAKRPEGEPPYVGDMSGGEMPQGTPPEDGGTPGAQMPGGPGGGMMEESSGYLTITGGTLYVNADGDGLDANTDIIQKGGDIVVEGPTNNGNGSLDYGNSYMLTKGTLTAIGSAGMLQSISEESKACAVNVIFTDNVAEGTTLSVETPSGSELTSIKISKVAKTFQFAGDGLKEGGTYRLLKNGNDVCWFKLSGKVTTVDDTGAETTISGMNMDAGHPPRGI